MSAPVRTQLSRRSFIASSATALTVAVQLPALAQTAQPAAPVSAGPPPPPNRHPSSFIRIFADGKVTFVLPTVEMGQGTQTGQAQILAEELGVDIRSVTITVPTQPQPEYRIHMFNQMRSVGSYGIRYWHDPLRRAAAQARIYWFRRQPNDLASMPRRCQSQMVRSSIRPRTAAFLSAS